MRAHASTREAASKDKVKQVLDLAMSSLTIAERKQLLDQLALKTQIGVAKAGDLDLDMWTEAVYRALVRVEGGEAGVGVGQLLVKRLLAAPASWTPVQEFMTASKLDKLDPPQRQSAYYMLADLLAEHAQQVADYTGAAFSPKFVAGLASNITGVFNRAFPGYLKAGLALVVARQRSAAR